MKKLYFVCLFFCLSISWAQVGINTTAPNAQLDIRSSNQATPSNTDGILIPKVDTFPATNPTLAQQGMLVYLTTTVGVNQPGYYYWDNSVTTWKPIAGISSGTLDQAYDFGGAGNGKTITADTGAVLINGTDGLVSTGVLNTGIIVPSGTGTRMVWNPRKAAFRVGNISGTQWDDASVGVFSTAIGSNSTASGSNSLAGSSATASGTSSFAFGVGASASGQSSIAMGNNANAGSQDAVSIGFFTTASGAKASAFGNGTTSSGFASTAFGGSTTASGSSSTAFGLSTTASGQNSTAFGSGTIASGLSSTAFGINNSSLSFAETVIGIGATTYTPSTNGATQFRAANSTDRLFVVGNAFDVNNNNIVDVTERSDALVILKNGSTGIGNSNPEGILDINSSNKGVLIPRIALTDVNVQLPVINPQGGNITSSTLIYNTATAGVSPNNVYPGFYYWDGSKWIRFDVNGENNPKYYTAIGTTNASSPPLGGLVPIPEMQVTLTPNDSVVLVNFSAAGFSANGACGQGGIFFQITLNGVPVKGWQTSVENIVNVPDRPLWDTTISYPITVTPGTPQTIQVLWYFPNCANLPFNQVTAPAAVAAGATYQAYRTLTVIDPNGGGGIVGSPPVTTNMWSQLGNIGTNAAVNFVGTSDAQPLVLKSNNLEALRVNTNGNIGIGTTTPLTKLHIAGNIRIADGTQAVGRVLTSDTNGTATWQNASNNAWGLFGNSGTNATTNFIGTTDNQSFALRTNNVERLFLSDIGNIGVGTITPARKLHVFNGASGGTSNANAEFLLESNLNQYQHFLSPSTTEGGFLFGSELASISGGILFNNPSTLNGFQFRAGGNVNRMAITSTGDVGIATLAPSERLELGNGNISVASGDIYLGNLNGVLNAGGGLMSAIVNYIGDVYVAPTQVNGDEDLYIADVLELGGQGYKPGGGAWVAPSDRRLKRNIEPYTDGLESLLKINPVTYQYNNIFKTLDTGETYVGVIAQDVQPFAPYMINEKPFGQVVEEDENGNERITNPGKPYLTFDSSALTYMLINSVKEMNEKYNQQKIENTELKTELDAQKTLLEQLMNRIEKLEK